MPDKRKSLVEKVIEVVISLLLTVIVALVLIQVLSRYLLPLPLKGLEELARLFFVWACFAGISLTTIKNEEIRIEVLIARLPKRIDNWLSLVSYSIVIMVSTVMMVSGYQFVVGKWIYPDYSTALLYPRALFWVPVPLTGTLIFIYTIRAVILKLGEMMGMAKPAKGDYSCR